MSDLLRADLGSCNGAGADRIARRIVELADTQPVVCLGLVGGRSVTGLYASLAARPHLPWDKVHLFVADERVVALDDPESNWAVIGPAFAEPLVAAGLMPEANVHPFRMDADAPDHGIAAYQAELDAVGGRLDLLVLSAGEDGHCASLFPHHPSVENDTVGYIHVTDSPKPPPERLSASRRLCEGAADAVLIFAGEGKRDALAKYADPELAVSDVPSKLVDALPAALVLTDLVVVPAPH